MSSSSSQQATAQTDNRRVVGESGISAENSIVTQNYETLDAEVANAAISAAAQASAQAAAAAAEANANAMNFGAAALNFGSNAVTDALGFAESSAARSQQLAYNTVQDAIASSQDTFQRAINYGATTTGRALDSLASTETLVANAYNDAKGRGALTDWIIIGAIGVMGLVAFMAVKK